MGNAGEFYGSPKLILLYTFDETCHIIVHIIDKATSSKEDSMPYMMLYEAIRSYGSPEVPIPTMLVHNNI